MLRFWEAPLYMFYELLERNKFVAIVILSSVARQNWTFTEPPLGRDHTFAECWMVHLNRDHLWTNEVLSLTGI